MREASDLRPSMSLEQMQDMERLCESRDSNSDLYERLVARYGKSELDRLVATYIEIKHRRCE